MAGRSENVVTLIDGRQVSSWSEDWRHETEARAILAMPTKAMRRAFLYGTLNNYGKQVGGVLGERGEQAVKQLEETMMAMWELSKKAG